MILIVHKKGSVNYIKDTVSGLLIQYNSNDFIKTFDHLCQNFTDEIILWCELDIVPHLDLDVCKDIFINNKIMSSYGVESFFTSMIGYVDNSPFVKVNLNVKYPTWIMSGCVGGISAAAYLHLNISIKNYYNYEIFLKSIAKIGISNHLFCYSDNRFLKKNTVLNESLSPKFSLGDIFNFIATHYSKRWVLIFFLNLFIYERKFPFWSFLKHSCVRKFEYRPTHEFIFKKYQNKKYAKPTIDVIIPTIGRSHLIENDLCYFAAQALIPNKIIIIEQQPIINASSELSDIVKKEWPFVIEHYLIYKLGVCNARNLGLSKTTADWVFLSDDDNEFAPDLLSRIFEQIEMFDADAVTVSYLQKDEFKEFDKVKQWTSFGAGNSLVKQKVLKNIEFNTSYEFGYGEDKDFGMQIRNAGADIIYLPTPEILHLKAPIGGFRTKFELPWHKDEVQPKPSPTVMLYYLKNKTPQQINSLKTILFIKYYFKQITKNPIKYIKLMNFKWDRSVFWAQQINK